MDVAALTGEIADYLAAALRGSVTEGVAGWRDDDLSFVRGWGIDLQAVEVPVSIWQGGQDRMVPYGHGRWLAEHVAGARTHLYDDEGHISRAGRSAGSCTACRSWRDAGRCLWVAGAIHKGRLSAASASSPRLGRGADADWYDPRG